VSGHPLVELDELIDLGAGQRPASLDQLLEPIPRAAVGQHERVDIHPAQPNADRKLGEAECSGSAWFETPADRKLGEAECSGSAWFETPADRKLGEAECSGSAWFETPADRKLGEARTQNVERSRLQQVARVKPVPFGVMSEVVTGDAVVLDVQIAQLPMRALGALIDIIVMSLGYLLSLMLWAATLTEFDNALTAAIMIIFLVLVIVGYPLTFETATRGRSVGKIVMGLRVVSDDGGPERFRQALFRALASLVEIWMFFGSPAVICSILSPKAKRIGDIFAGTIVVSERGPRLGPPPAMPPSLAWWASSLQLSGLSAGQAEVARQFLSRAPQLDPQLRQQMAYRIAGDVLSRIAPPPPPGTPPQLVLAAVLAERHRRELARLRPTVPPTRPPTAPAAWPQAGPPPWPSGPPAGPPPGWPPAAQQAIPWPEPGPAIPPAPWPQQGPQPDTGGFWPPH
jgi:uncharacterized RDD family membrane protein YckC